MNKNRLISVLLIALLPLGLMITSACGKGNNLHLESDETYTDNSYNNALFSHGNMVYADGKLYYNFTPNNITGILAQGTYCITDNSKERVQDFGITLYPSVPTLGIFQGKLFMPVANEDISQIYPVFKDFSSDVKFTVSENALYFYVGSKVYISKDGIHSETLFDKANEIGDMSPCYITEKSITYLSVNGHLKEYDFKKQEFIIDEELSKYDIHVEDKYNLIDYTFVKPLKCGDKTLLFADQTSKDFRLYDVSDGFKLLYTREYTNREASGGDDFCSYNVCGSNVYISNIAKGIDKIDLTTGRVTNLVPENTNDICIFGDKWVYYFSGDTVFRTSQDGMTTEKVS